MVVPATVDEEVEAINGDQVGEWILAVDAAERRDLHRSPHFCPTLPLLLMELVSYSLTEEKEGLVVSETTSYTALLIIVALLNVGRLVIVKRQPKENEKTVANKTRRLVIFKALLIFSIPLFPSFNLIFYSSLQSTE